MPKPITVTIRDAKGKRSTARFYVPDSTLPADAAGYASSLLAVIAPLTLGTIESASVTLDVDVSAYSSATPAANSDVEEVGRFLFTTQAGKTFRVSLPTWDEQFTNPGASTIDVADAAVIAFADQVAGGDYSDSNNVVISGLTEAYEAYGKTRR